MLLPRVIPCLLLHNGGLVKTVRFKDPKYVGDPINAIKIFNEKRVDELMLVDVSAHKQGKEPSFELLRDIASECFMPLCYGGGIRSVSQAEQILRLGVEKVALNHAALVRPEFIRDLARQIGSQSVVASIDVKRTWTGKYCVYDSVREKPTTVDPVEHACRLVDLGAGEVFVNNVDRDGTQQGYDLALVRRFTERLSVPVIACGGAWTADHLRGVVKEGGASAAAAGSMFVFQGPHRAVLISYPSHAEITRIMGT